MVLSSVTTRPSKSSSITASPANEEEAAALALNAGVEMEMVSRSYNPFGPQAAASRTRLSQATIDEAVRRILRIKFRLGLFDRPYTDEAREPTSLLRPESIRLAREIAGRSMVLLKNDRETLPLNKNVGSIAVIGPLADDRRAPLGWWAGDGKEENTVTPLAGIKAKVSAANERSVTRRAVKSKTTRPPVFRKQSISQSNLTSRLFLSARLHDMVGEAASRSIARSCRAGRLELVQAIHATGKPTIVVLVNGRPLVDRVDRRTMFRRFSNRGWVAPVRKCDCRHFVWRRESGR